MLKISTFSQALKTNERLAASSFSEDFIQEAVDKLCAKIRNKYGNIKISPEYRLNVSKRETEDTLTVFGEFCLGDGDFVSRTVEMPLPALAWNVHVIGEDFDCRLKAKIPNTVMAKKTE